MAKKRDRIPLTEAPSKPFNNAFAGLAALKEDLPDAPERSEASPGTVPEAKPPKGPKPKVVVSREKKGRAGKTVTRVAQLPLDTAGVATLADTMKKKLGCGGSVEDGDVILAGDQTKRAAAWLDERYDWRVVVGN